MMKDHKGIAQALGTTADSQLLVSAASEADAANLATQATSLLLFRAGSSQPKAVPLSLVTRREEIDARKIELSNGRHMIQYRGQLMPLVRMDANVNVRSE